MIIYVLGSLNVVSRIITTGSQKGNYYPLGKRTTVAGRVEGLLAQILDSRLESLQ